MAKMLEIIGLVLVAIMTLGFVGVFVPRHRKWINSTLLGMCRWNFNYNHV